jgi:transcriptional regulator with XRE-family HTH domain
MEQHQEARILRLRQVRIALGLTTEQVGHACGLDRSSISTYESLRAQPSVRALEAWERAIKRLARDVGHSAINALSDQEGQ